METVIFLFIISIAMFLGSYAAGSLPLITSLSDYKIRMFNALGAGLFIGTSLMVVVPEGVETIYSSSTEKTHHSGIIGLSLIVGFSLMFLIDQVSSLHVSSNSNNTIEYAELSTLESNQQPEPESTIKPSMTPTIGLVVHAAADGIALGASVSDPQLSMVVFLAVMLHKAPASFALTSVLLANGLSHSSTRKHLILFALSAPLGAMLTYFTLYLFSSSFLSVEYWTGVLLVFSGGTFLYVAMHALQEATQHHQPNKKNQTTTWVILGGMIVPILLSVIDVD